MSSRSKQLLSAMEALSRQSEELRDVLARYEAGSVVVTGSIGRGELVTDALEAAKGPIRRREVTDAMKAFERARHRVRLHMFSLAAEQGISASHLARQLGISRQLASRLSREAADEEA